MYSIALFGQRVIQRFSYFSSFSRFLCNQQSDTDGTGNGFGRIEDYLNESWKSMNCDNNMKDKSEIQESIDFIGINGCYEGHFRQNFSSRHNFIERARYEASMILEILQQDGPGFDAKAALDSSHITVSSLLVREVLLGYVVAGELDKAQELFTDMIINGQLPNVFTYNSMIRGLCMAEKFDEACMMVKEMEIRGCNPNFMVYSTLVSYLKNAGNLSKAHEVIRHMVEKGQYIHLVPKFKRYRRC